MRTFGFWAVIVSIAIAPGPTIGSIAQRSEQLNPSMQSQRAVRQIERAAMRVAHADLSHRGVTDWNEVGFDPNVDAHMASIHPARDAKHSNDLLRFLGGKRISTDSVKPNTSDCDAGSLKRLVYLNRPVILGDSAGILVTYAFRGQKSSCQFFFESKTLAFIRQKGDWFYVGVQGPTIRT